MIITIDGPAAAGKGTLASKLALKYHLAYFDTGMLYRAVGLEMVLQQYPLDDEEKAQVIAQKLTFPQMMELSQHADFRSSIGGDAASKVSAMPKVRAALLKMQQDFALSPVYSDGTPAKGAVYDGRDTGTTICPQADLKIFITATPQVRAMRRFKEFQQRGSKLTYEEVLKQTLERDERDSSRAASPLRAAEDAVVLDTSAMQIDEVFSFACNLVEKILEK